MNISNTDSYFSESDLSHTQVKVNSAENTVLPDNDKKYMTGISGQEVEGKSINQRICVTQKPYKDNPLMKFHLMEQFIQGKTEHFSDSDWLYLIIKMGNRRMPCNSKKRKLFSELIEKYGSNKFHKKKSELCLARLKLEDEVVKRGHIRRKIYYAFFEKKIQYGPYIQEIIDETKKGSVNCKFLSPEKLYSPDEIGRTTHNNFLSLLTISCCQKNAFAPPKMDTGAKIEKSIKENIEHSTFTENTYISSLIEAAHFPDSICGGRTLKVKQGKETYYLKFMRGGEKTEDFIREKAIHETLHARYHQDHCKSEIPMSKGLFKCPYKDQFEEFSDKLTVHSNADGSRFVSGYCFLASPDYVAYAWMQDSANPEDPCKSSEEGLKKAAFDIGIYARHGLTFDSIIPMQHDTIRNKRRWISLSGVLGNSSDSFYRNYDANPGMMCKWLTSGTDRPDISWSGLRDLGDSTFINDTNYDSAIFKERGLREIYYFEPVRKNLVFFNTLLDNFLAIFVLYARLHRSGHNYHYKNPKAVSDLVLFIENILSQFLQGFYDSPDLNLKAMLGISTTDYNQWLTRAATEIIYWTAVQPTSYLPVSPDQLPVVPPTDYEESYSKHIINTEFPDIDLYPHQTYSLLHPYQRLVNVGTHNEVLGLSGCTFPFLALLKGIPFMFTRMMEYSDIE